MRKNNLPRKFKRCMQNVLETCPAVSALLTVVENENHKLYLVGGLVRDLFLGKSSRDVDFVSPSAVDLTKSVTRQGQLRAVSIDRKFGTVRLVPRKRVGAGELCRVDLSPLRGASIEDDLHQRDFTINACAVDMSAWMRDKEVEFIDPLGGVLDVQSSRLRSCSQRSFTDDPLRILRAYRLACTYGLTVEDSTKENIVEARSGLNMVAVERVRDELVQILSEKNSLSALVMMDRDDVLSLVLPECIPLRHVEQNQIHRQDVWQHSLYALDSVEFFLNNPQQLLGGYAGEPLAVLSHRIAGERTRETALKLAVLFHDIGKPNSMNVDKEGSIRFHNHQIIGARLAASLCSRLRFSTHEINHISELVRQHMRPAYLFNSKTTSTKALARFFGLGPEVFWPLLLLFAANYSSKRGLEHALGPLSDKILSWLDFYTEHLKPREHEPPLVNGNDLINRLQLPPGPTVGRLLNQLAQLQWEGEITTRRQALDRAAQLLKQWKEAREDRR